ncbi:MAG: FAD-dependent oxidoreductase [Spirochaetaceae bacterium]|jgi:thioredoxin reductase (NADPH)|nr:FAD-dependent oxidoreductase [Spirochaetaceae bacterium]
MRIGDVLIRGAGPAGRSAAQYGARAALRVLVHEMASVGGQLLNIDRLENYPGCGADSGAALAEVMRAQALEAGAEFAAGNALSLAENGAGGFTVGLDDYGGGLESASLIQAGAVLIASGADRKTIGVPGEAELYGRGVSYCAACDGPFFKNKKIFVVGGGDAACDEARFLARVSPNVHLVHRRSVFRAQSAVAARVLSDPAVNVRLDTAVIEIKGAKKVESVVLQDVKSGKTSEESADAVFIFAGIAPRSGLAASSALKTRPDLDASGFIVTDQRMATRAPGIFAAGDVRSSPFRQVVTAAGDGSIAAHSAAKYLEDGTVNER